MKKLIKKTLVSLLIAGATLIPTQSFGAGFLSRIREARHYHHSHSQTYTQNNQTYTQPNQTYNGQSFNEYVNSEHGVVYAKNILIIGYSHGISDAQQMMREGATDPEGNKYDYILSSNFTGNKVTNAVNSVFNNVGFSVIGPGDQIKGVQKIIVDRVWNHSEGCDYFVNLANAGMIKAKEIVLMSPPMANGPGYLSKLEIAVMKAGVKEIKIDQNMDDYLTRTPSPALQLVSPGNNAIGFGMRIPLPEKQLGFGKTIDVEWNRNYTSSGENKNYTISGIKFNDNYNVPKSGHSLESYYVNRNYIEKSSSHPTPQDLSALRNSEIFRSPTDSSVFKIYQQRIAPEFQQMRHLESLLTNPSPPSLPSPAISQQVQNLNSINNMLQRIEVQQLRHLENLHTNPAPNINLPSPPQQIYNSPILISPHNLGNNPAFRTDLSSATTPHNLDSPAFRINMPSPPTSSPSNFPSQSTVKIAIDQAHLAGRSFSQPQIYHQQPFHDTMSIPTPSVPPAPSPPQIYNPPIHISPYNLGNNPAFRTDLSHPTVKIAIDQAHLAGRSFSQPQIYQQQPLDLGRIVVTPYHQPYTLSIHYTPPHAPPTHTPYIPPFHTPQFHTPSFHTPSFR